ncbi:MAG: HD domain-containing protein [Bacteroidales bacterium]|jgi:predicted metal-dependent HD superfamily phosphohydrolase
MDYKGTEKYIISKIIKELPNNLYYHTIDHTLDVLKAVETYSSMEKIRNKEDLIILKTAALFHDSGYIVQYFNNEVASIQIVCETLPEFGYSLRHIERISKLILSTEIPRKPKNIFEKILCDADLDYLGRDDFYMIGIRLLREWNENEIPTSLKEWYIQEIYFLEQHEYYTKSAIKLRLQKMKEHLAELKDLIGFNL